MRKIYILPNLVTTANLFCGFYAIILATQGQFELAAWTLIAATVFDALDGRIARLARATSNFGVEYDSLSDLTSFGLAPGVILYLWVLEPMGRFGWLAGFLFVACAALRLARFNVSSFAEKPKKHFQGMPSPVAAGSLATFMIFQYETGFPGEASDLSTRFVALGMLLANSALMVSLIPFPSFKEINWRSRASFGYLMIGVLALVLIALKPSINLFLVVAAYITFTLVWNLWIFARGKAPSKPGPSTESQA
jgi:CDP-diacylglycerol--serine O-phosphatidyltransferase